jgi:hypothetical protein
VLFRKIKMQYQICENQFKYVQKIIRKIKIMITIGIMGGSGYTAGN